jgi:type II secretory pathway pseudopilin PulG
MLRRRAFMIFDAILAMGICGVMLAVVAVSLNSQQKASRQLADYRAATRLAERSLARLQQGLPAVKPVGEDLLAIEDIVHTPAPDHFKWVRLTASRNGCSVQLFGLTPTGNRGK